MEFAYSCEKFGTDFTVCGFCHRSGEICVPNEFLFFPKGDGQHFSPPCLSCKKLVTVFPEMGKKSSGVAASHF